MTTNQTIDGVSRRMLTALLCHVSELENRALVDELRALLDAAPHGWKPCSPELLESGVDCATAPRWSAKEWDGHSHWHPAPAAQPQGGPFAWWCWNPGMGPNGTDAVFVSASHPKEQIVENHSWNKVIADQPLYAEQPAPVTVVMRCSFCDVVNEHGSPWSCHSESVDGNLVYRVIGCKDHKHLVDACLDELKRLNPSL